MSNRFILGRLGHLPCQLSLERKIFPNMSQNSFIVHHRHMRIPCSRINTFSISVKLSIQHQLSIVHTLNRFIYAKQLDMGGSQTLFLKKSKNSNLKKKFMAMLFAIKNDPSKQILRIVGVSVGDL